MSQKFLFENKFNNLYIIYDQIIYDRLKEKILFKKILPVRNRINYS